MMSEAESYGMEDNERRSHNPRSAPSLVREPRVSFIERKKERPLESLDFDEAESNIWRKHQQRRFFNDRGDWWTGSKRSTAYKWMLLIAVGVIIACIGAAVQIVIEKLYEIKFGIANGFLSNSYWGAAFFSYLAFAIFFALLASLLCVIEPYAAGSGIPEVKAYLNGVNLNKAMRWRVLFTKSIGMCFSVASGLPLGKEGPMIHTGSIVGAAV
jgi:chloride channel 7